MEGVDSARMDELLVESCAKVVGRQQEKTYEEIVKLCLGILMAETSKILIALEAGEFDASPPEVKPFPPLLERAHARKQESVDLDSLRWQIDKKDTEIMELKKALRFKVSSFFRRNFIELMACSSGRRNVGNAGEKGNGRKAAANYWERGR